jgi:hypothetical protein
MEGQLLREAVERSILSVARKLDRRRFGAEVLQQLLSAPDAIRSRAPLEPLCAVDAMQADDFQSMQSLLWLRFITQCGYDIATCLSLYKNFMFTIAQQPFDFHACKLLQRLQLQKMYGTMYGNLIADCIMRPDQNPIMAAMFSREFDAIASFAYVGCSVGFDVAPLLRVRSSNHIPIVKVVRHEEPIDRGEAEEYFRKYTGCELTVSHDFSAYRNDYYEIVERYRPEDLRQVEAALEAGEELPLVRRGEMLTL